MFDKLDKQFTQYEPEEDCDLYALSTAFEKSSFAKQWIKKEENNTYLCFQGRIGRYTFNGNDLIDYPELAKALSTLRTYPKITVQQDISFLESYHGVELITLFADIFRQSYTDYHRLKESLDREANALVQCYGHTMRVPTVQSIFMVERRVVLLELNGVAYFVPERLDWQGYQGNAFREKPYQVINLVEMMSDRTDDNYLDRFHVRITLLGGMCNTPFIRVRYRADYHHKGHEKWIDLKDRCWLTRREAIKKAKQDYGIQQIEEITVKEIKALF